MRFVYILTPMQILMLLVFGVIVAVKLTEITLTYGYILLVLEVIWFFLMTATHAALNVWAQKVGGVSVQPFHVENFRPFFSIGQVIRRIKDIMDCANPELAHRSDSPAVRKLGVFLFAFVAALTAIYAIENAMGLIGADGAWNPSYAFAGAGVIAWIVKNKFEAQWAPPADHAS